MPVLVTSNFDDDSIVHERGRPIQKRDLGVFVFIEYIRKLTIKFLCLFKIRLRNPISIPPFQGWSVVLQVELEACKSAQPDS